MITPPTCPYCKAASVQVTGKELYPHRSDLFKKIFFQCTPCKAHVGTHFRTGQPLGSLANAQLRAMRSQAHQSFDPLWMMKGLQRKQAYAHLAAKMSIPIEECHIGAFNIAQCKQVIDLCNSGEIYRGTNKNRSKAEVHAADGTGNSDVRKDGEPSRK